MNQPLSGKTIVLFANSYETFRWHRYHLASELQKNNKVHVILPFPTSAKYVKFINENFKVHNIHLNRKSQNPIRESFALFQLLFLLKRIKPDIIHNFTIKCVIYGTFISSFIGVEKIINSITGLGFVFLSEKKKVKMTKNLVILAYKRMFRKKNVKVIFQNYQDMALFKELKIIQEEQAILVPGSGVELSLYSSPTKSLNPKHIKFLFMGRLLKDKGLMEVLEAVKNLKKKYSFTFSIAGEIDQGNPKSINSQELVELSKHCNYVGFCEDSVKIIGEHDVMVLPSYREGLSKFLLEGMASRKAIVAANVPGCHELVEHNYNGFLCEAKDSKSLETSMELCIKKPDSLNEYGNNSFQKVQEYNLENITKKIMETYK